MKLKILIVDDEYEARALLQLYLKKRVDIEIVGMSANGQRAVEDIKELQPQVILLDIQMPEWNGFQVIEQITEPYPHFIFITAYDQYAVSAFEKNALDYILKPYSELRLNQAIDKAKLAIQREQSALNAEKYRNLLLQLSSSKTGSEEPYLQRLAVKSSRRTRFIDVADIIYLEAADQYVDVFTAGEKFTIRDSINHLAEVLDPKAFFRTHRSYIVKLDQVSSVENVDKYLSLILLKNGKKIKLSTSRKGDFKTIFRY